MLAQRSITASRGDKGGLSGNAVFTMAAREFTAIADWEAPSLANQATARRRSTRMAKQPAPR